MESSSQAELQISKLMTELTSNKLEHNYRGTTQEFILDWQNKIREYENLTPPEAHFPDGIKKSMLENALKNLRCFRDVK